MRISIIPVIISASFNISFPLPLLLVIILNKEHCRQYKEHQQGKHPIVIAIESWRATSTHSLPLRHARTEATIMCESWRLGSMWGEGLQQILKLAEDVNANAR